VTLGDVVGLLHGWYPPATAESWDAVGLVWGDLARPVRKVMFAVDPVQPVVDDAVAWGADLLVVHHPLFLRGVHGFSAETPKGRALTTLANAGCALLTAHTNADVAVDGVSDAMARALGLTEIRPLVPATAPALDKLTTYVPLDHADRLREVLAEAGAGRIGDYDRASFSTVGEGRFRPLDGANPAIGTVGELEVVPEIRIEVVLPRSRRSRVVSSLLAAHPYEEPAWDVVALADVPAPTGTGRVGRIEPVTLAAFAETVASALPAAPGVVRVAGDVDAVVETVALCGGAGDAFLDDVLRAGADVYVTSDLRHHVASEFLDRGGRLVDVPHWSAEWTWLPVVAAKLRAALGDTVETHVNDRVTDPWTHAVAWRH